MAKPLPTIQNKGKTYFIDLRLGEIRNKEIPSDTTCFCDIEDPLFLREVNKIIAKEVIANARR